MFTRVSHFVSGYDSYPGMHTHGTRRVRKVLCGYPGGMESFRVPLQSFQENFSVKLNLEGIHFNFPGTGYPGTMQPTEEALCSYRYRGSDNTVVLSRALYTDTLGTPGTG